MDETKIEVNKGTILLRKPLAGPRNKAMIKADTAEGMKATVFLVELLPHMIKEHPFGAEPIKSALDSLSIEEYDKLIDGARKVLELPEGDVEKKSEELSLQGNSLEVDGSEKNS